MEAETVHTDISKQDILNSLEEGLLYLNDNLDISEEYSGSLERIIDQEITAGQSFVTLFENVNTS